MMISAKMTGMTEFERRLKKLVKRKNYDVPMELLVKETAKLARLYAPRKTGDLEESIRDIKTGFGKYKISVNVPYASYMEYGTKYFPVGTAESPRARTSTSGKACYHPFLRPAVWEMMNMFPEMVKKTLFG